MRWRWRYSARLRTCRARASGRRFPFATIEHQRIASLVRGSARRHPLLILVEGEEVPLSVRGYGHVNAP